VVAVVCVVQTEHSVTCSDASDKLMASGQLVLHWSIVVVSGHSYYSCLLQLLVKQVLEVNCLKYTCMSVSVLVVPKIELPRYTVWSVRGVDWEDHC